MALMCLDAIRRIQANTEEASLPGVTRGRELKCCSRSSADLNSRLFIAGLTPSLLTGSTYHLVLQEKQLPQPWL